MASIYDPYYDDLVKIQQKVLDDIEDIKQDIMQKKGMNPIEHCLSRIKDEASMKEKCLRKHLPINSDSALHKIQDAIGVRIVCAFLDDVYDIRDALLHEKHYEIIREKDYIKNVKPSGYRSLHLIVKVDGYFVEFQLRTISQDTWAALEHHMRYKKDIKGDLKLIESELKRYADELAATDISMQTIRNMIIEEGE